jgi:hypothetical protein
LRAIRRAVQPAGPRARACARGTRRRASRTHPVAQGHSRGPSWRGGCNAIGAHSCTYALRRFFAICADFCKIPETGGTRSHPADLRRLYPRRPNSLRGLVRRDGAPPSRPVWGVMMANPTLAISRAEQASGPRLRGVMASPSGRCNSVRLDWAPRSGVGLTDEPSSIRSATGTGETTGASSSHRCRAVG